MELEKTMFREYDIRGRESESELNESSMYHIARGFSRMLSRAQIKEVIVGHDARGTSEAFHKAAEKGFMDSGINVIDIGTVTTPMSYWAQYFLKTRGLCMVTASHNPAGWNGVKLGTDLSKTLLPEEIKELYAIIEAEEYVNPVRSSRGALNPAFTNWFWHSSPQQASGHFASNGVNGNGVGRSVDIREEYMKDLLSRARISRKLKVLVNTGNGTAGLFAPELFRAFGCEVVERFTNVDPSYPNYTPNTDGTAMMEDTGRETVAHRCDIGFAFDGDGDRLGIVDEKGSIIWPDRYMILLSRLVLSKNLGAKIVFDVKVSEALPEDIVAHGGTPIMCKTGHSYIKARMMEEGALLAGEMSGHIFFKDNFYGFDDAFFAGLKVLEYVSAEGKPVSEIVASTPYYISTPTIQVQTTDKEKYGIVEKLTEEFKSEGYRVVDINGARVYMEDGWGLVRASSNTPTLVLRFEAKTEEGLERIQKIFREKLGKFDSVNKKWDASGN